MTARDKAAQLRLALVQLEALYENLREAGHATTVTNSLCTAKRELEIALVQLQRRNLEVTFAGGLL